MASSQFMPSEKQRFQMIRPSGSGADMRKFTLLSLIGIDQDQDVGRRPTGSKSDGTCLAVALPPISDIAFLIEVNVGCSPATTLKDAYGR
jgi:hypothetical protein